MSKAVEDVLLERHRQIVGKGFDHAHDDKYESGELRKAAACYIFSADRGPSPLPPIIWPWDGKWWKPKSTREDLVRSAALIIADIERLDRLSTPHTPTGE